MYLNVFDRVVDAHTPDAVTVMIWEDGRPNGRGSEVASFCCENAPNLDNPMSNRFYRADLAAQIGIVEAVANGTYRDSSPTPESVAVSDA
jgi:hypothetical protein